MRSALIFKIFLVLSISSASAQENQKNTDNDSDKYSCGCEAGDSRAKPDCGPRPAFLDVVPNVKSTNSCEATDALKSEKSTVTNIQSFIDGRFLNYVSCHRETKERFCHVKETLLARIKQAASVSGLPFEVQACLYQQESNFNSTATSNVNAMGYVQFMPETLQDFRGYLLTGEDGYKKLYLDNKNELETLASSPKLTRSQRMKLMKLRRKSSVYYAIMRALHVWNQYWAATPPPDPLPKVFVDANGIPVDENGKVVGKSGKLLPGMEPFVEKSFPEGTFPSPMFENDVRCPNVAFAAGAMKQTLDLFLMTKGTEVSDDESLPSLTANHSSSGTSSAKVLDEDSSIMLAGAYNGGIGGFAKICGSSKSLEDCIARYHPVRGKPWRNQTRNHMKVIRDCVQEITKGPSNREMKETCEKRKCSII